MKIVKAKASAGCKHGSCGYYEINVWYSDTDLKSNGIIKNIDMDTMRNAVGIQKGYGFARIQKFFNTDEGKQWLEKELFKESYKN